jgi:hypothetical protein
VAFEEVIGQHMPARRVPALLALLGAALVGPAGMACGGGSADGSSEPDAAPENPFSCEDEPESGDPFDFRVGLRSEDAFHEITDGDQAPVELGPQGLYMLQLDVQATLSIPSAAVCFFCSAAVSPAGTWPGVSQPGVIALKTAPGGPADSFAGTTIVILAGGIDQAAQLDGADVDLTVHCDGHGFSAESQHALQLFLAR